MRNRGRQTWYPERIVSEPIKSSVKSKQRKSYPKSFTVPLTSPMLLTVARDRIDSDLLSAVASGILIKFEWFELVKTKQVELSR